MGILRGIERGARGSVLRTVGRLHRATGRLILSPEGIEPGWRPERILLIRVDRLGDAVISTPVIRRLRQEWPEARIEIVLGEKNRGIAPLLPDIDRTMVWSRRPGELRRTIGSIRRVAYDLVIDLHTDRSSNAESISLIARRGYLLQASRLPEVQTGHIVPATAGVLDALGIDHSIRSGNEVATRPELRVDMRKAAESSGEVGVNISSGGLSRTWPQRDYTGLIDRLRARGIPVALVAHPSDRDRAIELAGGRSGVRVEARSDLSDYLRLLSGLRAFVSPDSGGVHMAVACGTPVVGLYATGSKTLRWHPWGVPYRTLQGSGSISSITHEQVFMTLMNLLQEGQ